ncbi:MAG: transporter [Solimicrobium sp.]|nr:transporter [Solimicrobium sp.]
MKTQFFRNRLSQFSVRFFSCIAISFFLQACASKQVPIKYYDFGVIPKPVAAVPAPGPACKLPLLQLADITAPSSLSSNMMLYRLLYSDEQQTHTYANHRWNMTPVQLLTQRIKMQLAARGAKLIDSGINKLNVLQLRLEIEDFNQYFTDATRSYAQLQIRASLIREHKLLAQTMLQQQVNADSADAPAGAKAMRLATDELILNLTHWLCEQTEP